MGRRWKGRAKPEERSRNPPLETASILLPIALARSRSPHSPLEVTDSKARILHI